MRCPLSISGFWILIHSYDWEELGGMSLLVEICHGRQADLRLKTSCLPWCTLSFWYPQKGTELRMWTLSFFSSAIQPVCYYSSCHDADELYFLWKCKPQISPSYYKLPWSSCFIAAIKIANINIYPNHENTIKGNSRGNYRNHCSWMFIVFLNR